MHTLFLTHRQPNQLHPTTAYIFHSPLLAFDLPDLLLQLSSFVISFLKLAATLCGLSAHKGLLAQLWASNRERETAWYVEMHSNPLIQFSHNKMATHYLLLHEGSVQIHSSTYVCTYMYTSSGPHKMPLFASAACRVPGTNTHAHSTIPMEKIALHLVSLSPVLTPFLSTFCFLQPFHQLDMPLQNTAQHLHSILPTAPLVRSYQHLLTSTDTYTLPST